jgi:hypothetical protein
MNWQQIVLGSLNMWVPVAGKDIGKPRVRANYYSQPFVADFIGNSGKTKVVPLNISSSGDDKGLHVGYAAYDNGRLARLALLNLKVWDRELSQSTTRPLATFSIDSLPSTITTATVYRLSSKEGALAQTNLTYAGLEWTYENGGRGGQVPGMNGTTVVNVGQGQLEVDVEASSAVLIDLS